MILVIPVSAVEGPSLLPWPSCFASRFEASKYSDLSGIFIITTISVHKFANHIAFFWKSNLKGNSNSILLTYRKETWSLLSLVRRTHSAFPSARIHTKSARCGIVHRRYVYVHIILTNLFNAESHYLKYLLLLGVDGLMQVLHSNWCVVDRLHSRRDGHCPSAVSRRQPSGPAAEDISVSICA